MSEPTDVEIIDAMLLGGSFANALAKACYRADAVNLAKIKAAFPELWAEYAELATLKKQRDRAVSQ